MQDYCELLYGSFCLALPPSSRKLFSEDSPLSLEPTQSHPQISCPVICTTFGGTKGAPESFLLLLNSKTIQVETEVGTIAWCHSGFQDWPILRHTLWKQLVFFGSHHSVGTGMQHWGCAETKEMKKSWRCSSVVGCFVRTQVQSPTLSQNQVS